jgi:hypothetical protein
MNALEREVKAIVQKVISEAKAAATVVESEVVHVAKSDFDALVSRVEALESRRVDVPEHPVAPATQADSKSIIAALGTEPAQNAVKPNVAGEDAKSNA